ncbi:DUF4296 domain-containing protein [Gillisia limnaea]|nr:DUF4296 domain-containing protein [Gillisia limnaea]
MTENSMKPYRIFIFALFLVSCQNVEKVKEPENLISEAKMTEVLTDLSLLNSAKNFNKRILEETGLKPDEYLYEKHGIDSLQLAQSNEYYAKNYDKLESIYQRVKVKLEKMQVDLEKIQKEETRIKDSIKLADSISRNKYDSLSVRPIFKKPFIDSLVSESLPVWQN